MRPRFLLGLVVVPAIGLLALDAPPPVHGCAPAPRRGSHVDISAETAIIIWDGATKTQHFIRTASFSSNTADFGFLVPTPTRPELAEATTDGFSVLASVTAPRVIVQTRDAPIGCGGMMPTAAPDRAKGPPAGGVEVLERKRVGPYDAAVLKAEDPKELRDWLAKNGYDARPHLEDWFQVYTQKKWILTAFKIAVDSAAPAGQPSVRSIRDSVVRMSFATEQPFFPYREPEDQRAASADRLASSRFLHVYFLADARFDGKLGDGSQTWPGRTVWANRIERPTVDSVAKAARLSNGLADREWWLTEFEDRSSPRPGTDDVTFLRSPDQGTVERPPIIHYEYRQRSFGMAIAVTLALAFGVVLVIAVLLWRMTRRPVGAG